MRAVLVFDMPKDCYECPCVCDEFNSCQACNDRKRERDQKGIPSWCPLRPLPERKDVPEYLETNRDWEAWGYDQCIAEILGSVATGETE